MIGRTNPHAKALRRNSTDAEKLLWQRLRSRQLAGLKFRRQATIGPYVVDFQCVEVSLVVEIDGGQHCPERDAERTEYLQRLGWRVIRFWNNDVLQNLDGVLVLIALEAEKENPSPNPLPPAGEG